MADIRERIRAALAEIRDPAKAVDIVAAGQVASLAVDETGRVDLVLEVDPRRAEALEPLRAAAETATAAVEGVTAVRAILTAHAESGSAASSPYAGARDEVPNLKPAAAKPATPQPDRPGPTPIPDVDRVIAVASGKGGVGKSTLAANLAVALAGRGRRVGLLDADVYGPSQPRMLGVTGRPASPDGKVILPLRNHGVTVMSLGLMVPEEQAIAWRGPMLMTALKQMLGQVQWGRLDDLIVDLPPGTGDVQMTLCQQVPVAGAVIISTPQDIALIDARKGVDMFRKLDVPVMGIVENMAAFVCGSCGAVHHPFGHGGAKAEAERMGVPFLGEVPLDLDIRVSSDGGAPIVATKPDGPQSQAFYAVADALIAAGAPA